MKIQEILASSEPIGIMVNDQIQFKNSCDSIFHLHRREGSTFPAQVHSIPIDSPVVADNETLSLLLISDLSELEQLKTKNKQLERQAEIGTMIASFAHDVRNVFNSIKLSAETIGLKSSVHESVRDYAESIKDDCDRINQLMESVLSFSTSIEENMQSMDIAFLIQRLIERWIPKLERTRVVPVFQKEGEIPLILGDQRSLEQVFNNLFSNARDAMNKTGGTLGIFVGKQKVDEEKTVVIIKVSDSGLGIPEEFIGNIFDPYFSSRPGGTGLGLAITKKIVTLHNGNIEVYSFPGGTTFTVSFPSIIDGV